MLNRIARSPLAWATVIAGAIWGAASVSSFSKPFIGWSPITGGSALAPLMVISVAAVAFVIYDKARVTWR